MRKVLVGLSAVLMAVSLFGGVGALAQEEKIIAWIPSDIFPFLLVLLLAAHSCVPMIGQPTMPWHFVQTVSKIIVG